MPGQNPGDCPITNLPPFMRPRNHVRASIQMVFIGPSLAARTHDSLDGTSEETVPRSVLRPHSSAYPYLAYCKLQDATGHSVSLRCQGTRYISLSIYMQEQTNRCTIACRYSTLDIAASHNFSSFPSPKQLIPLLRHSALGFVKSFCNDFKIANGYALGISDPTARKCQYFYRRRCEQRQEAHEYVVSDVRPTHYLIPWGLLAC